MRHMQPAQHPERTCVRVVAQAAQTAAAAAAAHSTADANRQVLQAANSNLKDELHSRAAAIEALVAARDEALTSLAKAKREMDVEQAAAVAAKAAAAALERQLGDLSAQVRPGRPIYEATSSTVAGSRALQFGLKIPVSAASLVPHAGTLLVCCLYTPSGPAAGIQRGSGAGSSRICAAAAA